MANADVDVAEKNVRVAEVELNKQLSDLRELYTGVFGRDTEKTTFAEIVASYSFTEDINQWGWFQIDIDQELEETMLTQTLNAETASKNYDHTNLVLRAAITRRANMLDDMKVPNRLVNNAIRNAVSRAQASEDAKALRSALPPASASVSPNDNLKAQARFERKEIKKKAYAPLVEYNMKAYEKKQLEKKNKYEAFLATVKGLDRLVEDKTKTMEFRRKCKLARANFHIYNINDYSPKTKQECCLCADPKNDAIDDRVIIIDHTFVHTNTKRMDKKNI